jgi:hypothetical protein
MLHSRESNFRSVHSFTFKYTQPYAGCMWLHIQAGLEEGKPFVMVMLDRASPTPQDWR